MTTSKPPMQLWGGIECTINRVADRYFDQLDLCGFGRDEHFEAIAALGIRTLRYPVLWEAVAPDSPEQMDWRRSDAHLAKLRALGIRPIIGLLHHGSGPRYTDLLDVNLAEKFAAFAAAVARRYPWIDAFTPINEPLTTARFSCLYGHWFPHRRDDRSFAEALLNQARATVLAMKAVRDVNSAAILVQTEDLGITFAEPALAYQAEFENERRWLTWDLLAGRVDHDHPMHQYLQWAGATRAKIDILREQPCAPDVVGVNYYVTSERYLDDRIEHYSPESWGGNGRQVYVDEAAVRVRAQGLAGIETLLTQAFERYALPLAVTEIHLGCTQDEQIRWLADIWNGAERARIRGADVRAATVWALFGSCDWDSLVTRPNKHRESGAFDLRDGKPVPTALAAVIKQLAAGESPRHPALTERGWWRKSSRLHNWLRSSAPPRERELAAT